MRLCVLDLDGSVAAQPPLLARVAAGMACHADLRDLAPRLRLAASRSAIRAFLERLEQVMDSGPGPEVIFYGSGDFHHLTAAFLQRRKTPVTVIHLDNHPDWVTFPATFNCGAWVNRALENANVAKVITIGPCSDDLAWPQLKGANLAAIAARRLEVYPWRHPPSRLVPALPRPKGLPAVGHRLHWHTVGGAAWTGFVADLSRRIPTRDVWITIDKDVFAPDEAVTNWDQGEMRLAHAMALVREVAERHAIIGVDVCGDYSPPRLGDPWRRVLAFLDRSCRPLVTRPHEALNADANAQLLRLFDDVLA